MTQDDKLEVAATTDRLAHGSMFQPSVRNSSMIMAWRFQRPMVQAVFEESAKNQTTRLLAAAILLLSSICIGKVIRGNSLLGRSGMEVEGC